MRRWRKMTWVVLAWCVLIVVWVIGGSISASNSDSCADEVGDMRQLCEDASAIGTGIGVMLVLGIGFVGFVFLSIIWFMTRPQPQSQVLYAQAPGPQFAAPTPRAGPPPPPVSKPAGWYRDPGSKYDYRWFDAGWTEHVSNEGDSTVYADPVVR